MRMGVRGEGNSGGEEGRKERLTKIGVGRKGRKAAEGKQGEEEAAAEMHCGLS